MPALGALVYPRIDPVAVRVGGLAIRWYGLAYVAGFIAAGLLLRALNRRWRVGLSDDAQLDIVLGAVAGVIVGGRLGYVLFYDLGAYLKAPLTVFAVWDGGMSFHGGLAGILLAGILLARHEKVPFLRLADMGAVGAPIGFGLGRLANFVNGELWGRTTTMPWGMVFPGAGPLPRHPSQLYEALLEGVVLFCVMFALSRRKRPDGFMLGMMLALYGVFRILVEFVREPDVQLGLVAGPFSMGQLLSVPMVLVGVVLVVRAMRAHPAVDEPAPGADVSGPRS